MPCTPWPVCEKYKFTYDNYTSLWNVLDYEALDKMYFAQKS